MSQHSAGLCSCCVTFTSLWDRHERDPCHPRVAFCLVNCPLFAQLSFLVCFFHWGLCGTLQASRIQTSSSIRVNDWPTRRNRQPLYEAVFPSKINIGYSLSIMKSHHVTLSHLHDIVASVSSFGNVAHPMSYCTPNVLLHTQCPENSSARLYDT